MAWNKTMFTTATSLRLAPNFPTYREPLTEYLNLKGFSQFGFGRRTCQGVESVEQGLFLVMGGLAWAFDIWKERSRWGYEVPVPMDKYTSLLIAKPEKMVFEMKPVGEVRVQMTEKKWKDINGGETADVALNRRQLIQTRDVASGVVVWFAFLH